MSLTPAQQQAIAARGNILVVAGAGTGKTRTVVERCLHCLLEETPPAVLDEILMVTFTDAAAAEMRQRIRETLAERLRSAGPAAEQRHLQEQLALFETAHIGTLHSFCLQLVRQHFHQLGLDPQFTVLAEEEGALLAEETLDELLQQYYGEEQGLGPAVQQLVEAQGRGWDRLVRNLVLKLHRYSQARPDPEIWINQQVAAFAAPDASLWRDWLQTALTEWQARSLALARAADPENEVASNCASILEGAKPGLPAASAAETLGAILTARAQCKTGKKTAWVKPLESLFDETEFLLSLLQKAEGADPLAQDWDWVRGHMGALLELTRTFAQSFAEAKRELAVVDFQDLEQCALRLLWDAPGRPSAIAGEWRKKLRFVFVDEYQDINAAQDRIIEAVSREGDGANRFLVGDVKQSIYRFRLADPSIFQGYLRAWSQGAGGQTIPLVENFRSRQGLLEFVNSLFRLLMHPEVGGVDYDTQTRLVFGDPANRRDLGLERAREPCVELHLRVKQRAPASNGPDNDGGDEPPAAATDDVQDLEETNKEARLLGLRLKGLLDRGYQICDKNLRQFRPARWDDMAVLLRSPGPKAECYAKEFAHLGIPLHVERGGFYSSTEVTDLLSLLQVLDNPLQDIPLLAVLHSPIGGFNLDELAQIRLAAKRTHFWRAMTLAGGSEPSPESAAATEASPGLRRKIAVFLERFARWRRLGKHVSLSRCLETILAETLYPEWLLTQNRGAQRRANVRRLLTLAQTFDQFHRQGLFRFLRFIEAQQQAESEPEPAPSIDENAVRLMSIHQSKGLEFPIVALGDLAKNFNLRELSSEVLLDERYGLCPQVTPPQTAQRYPSLPYWLARQRQISEALGEELRLLYVALTRARDRLVITASISRKKFETLWQKPAAPSEISPAPPNEKELPPIALDRLRAARSYADWFGLWFAQNVTARDLSHDTTTLLSWTLHEDSVLAVGPAPEEAPAGLLGGGDAAWRATRERLAWNYAFGAATHQPAKRSVSALRRLAVESDEAAPAGPLFRRAATADTISAAEIGIAHHLFQEHVSLQNLSRGTTVTGEIARLQKEKLLTPDQVASLDAEGLAAFWQSEFGRDALARPDSVRRELAFTARFDAAEIAGLTGGEPRPELAKEFVVVQGVADLAMLLENEIRLVDFKTDAVDPKDLAARAKFYEVQLRLYAAALSRIYQRPVTGCWLYFLACRTAVPVPAN